MQVRSVILLCATALIIAGLFLWELSNRRPVDNLAEADFGHITSQILQNIHDEGFLPSEINYADPILLQRKIFITGDIDARAAEVVMQKMLYLDQLEPGKPIDLYLDSNGGSGGYCLSNFLRLLKSPVNTYALDWCCSSAAEILAAGTGKRRSFSAARIVVHIVPVGNQDEDDSEYSREKMENESTRIFWTQHAKMPKSIVEDKEERFYNFNAEEALKFGLIDEIIPKEGPKPEAGN